MRENGSPDFFYKTFAEYVRSECEKNDIPCIINDGLISKDEMFEKVKKLFGL